MTPSGDPSLAAVLATTQPPGSRRAAVVVVDGSGTRTACVGTDGDARFELGSVSKALTGMLLAAEVEAGRRRLDQRLDALDDRYAGTAVGDVTVRQLCTHRSGLPRMPSDLSTAARGAASGFFGTDPYRGVDADRVARAAARQRLGRIGYSNLGAAVLGNALANRASTSFAGLLRERVLDPLSMHDTGVSAEPGFRAPRGSSAAGRRAAPWLMTGYAPAGGLSTTPMDLAVLVAALVHRAAPGLAALTPLADRPDGPGRIGMFWLVDEARAWHNGRTGGYAAYLTVGDARGVAAVADVADSPAVERLARAAMP